MRLLVFVVLVALVSVIASDSYSKLQAEDDECAFVQTKQTFPTKPTKGIADEGFPPQFNSVGNDLQALDTAMSSLSTLSKIAGELASSTHLLSKKLRKDHALRKSGISTNQQSAQHKQANTTSSWIPSTSNLSFPEGLSSSNDTVLSRISTAGNVIKDFAFHGLHACAGTLSFFSASWSNLSFEEWAIIGTVVASLVCAAFLCYYIHVKGYVQPAFREKRKYISWEERQEQMRTQIAEDPVLNAIGIVPRIIVHVWDFLACCKVFWCSCSADTFKWLFVILVLFSFGCWQMWQSGLLQPVLNYLAVYLYFFAFIVACGILAIFEIWTRLRGGFINQIENLGKIQEKITSFEKKLGLAT